MALQAMGHGSCNCQLSAPAMCWLHASPSPCQKCKLTYGDKVSTHACAACIAFHLTRCLLLHRTSGVICAHLHMRSDTDQAVDMCTVLNMCWCSCPGKIPAYSLTQPLPLLDITFCCCQLLR